MNIARPVGGFKIILAAGVKAVIDNACDANPALRRHWFDIENRLRFVAHVEGVADNRFPHANRLWASAADEDRGLPRIKLIYLVMGDKVRIRLAAIG